MSREGPPVAVGDTMADREHSVVATSVPRQLAVTRFAERYGIVAAWIAVVIIFGLLEPSTYLTWRNVATTFSTQAVLLILALALLIPLTVGEFDLSVAGTMGLTFVLCPYLLVIHHFPFAGALAVMLLSGVGVGLVNGLVVIGIKVPSIIVTLGTGTILYGLSFALISGPIGGLSDGLTATMEKDVSGLQTPFFIAVALVAILIYAYNFHPIGRVLYFTGMNPEAARLSGIRIDRVRLLSFVTAGVIGACAGIILAGVDGGGDPSTAQSYLLPVFSAVFLGAAAITPGRVNPLGTFVAVYFLQFGVVGLEIQGLTGWVEQVFYGASLLVGVAIARPKTV